MPPLFDALRDLAELALGCTASVTQQAFDPEFRGDEASERMGGLVYLWGDSAALHVGVLATPHDCSTLAKRLLGNLSKEELPNLVVRGAMCELSYLLAGGVKRRLVGAGPLSVGQPCFMEGMIRPRLGWDVQALGVDIGGVPATLVCMERRPELAPA